MTPAELQAKLNEFIRLPAEIEWVEFKRAENNIHFDDLGKYFSALSNEANLKGEEFGWLILGVHDKPRAVRGTNYRQDRASLDGLKHEVAKQTTNRITFEEIHELTMPAGRVIMFQIPAALPGAPTAWKGHCYGRDGESIGALNPLEYERIRNQAIRADWTEQICSGASLEDLDPDAIAFARQQYKVKFPKLGAESDGWDDATFLSKAKVGINGEVTNAAMLLLGRQGSEHLLSPAVAQITWVLKDEHGADQDYEHFGLPFILGVDAVLKKIRILTLRQLPSGTLFPKEISQYDPWVIRESMHNCIVHQDYSKSGRISIVETPDSLLLTNVGCFLPGSVAAVIQRDAPPEQYPNSFLARAMVNLNMIDTIGSGIRRMFLRQKQRFFPMPDYDLSDKDRVQVRLPGKVLDENYTNVLIRQTTLDLLDVIALDKVQKKQTLSEGEFRSVKDKKLIEGRRPNIYVSDKIAAITGDKATYIKHRAFDKDYYHKMLLAYLEKFGQAKREDIDHLLLDKISDALTEDQKLNRIKNLLQEMRRDGEIVSAGHGPAAVWKLSRKEEDSDDS